MFLQRLYYPWTSVFWNNLLWPKGCPSVWPLCVSVLQQSVLPLNVSIKQQLVLPPGRVCSTATCACPIRICCSAACTAPRHVCSGSLCCLWPTEVCDAPEHFPLCCPLCLSIRDVVLRPDVSIYTSLSYSSTCAFAAPGGIWR